MNIDRAQLNANMAEAIEALPTPYVDGNLQVNCAFSPVQISQLPKLGGVIQQKHAEAIVRLEDAPGYQPTIGKVVTVNGVQYRTASVDKCAGVFWRIYLKDLFEA